MAMLTINDNSLVFVNRKTSYTGGEILTSTPVWATICAERKDGRPKKVIIGFVLARRALRRRSCGLLIEVVTADKQDIICIISWYTIETVILNENKIPEKRRPKVHFKNLSANSPTPTQHRGNVFIPREALGQKAISNIQPNIPNADPERQNTVNVQFKPYIRVLRLV